MYTQYLPSKKIVTILAGTALITFVVAYTIRQETKKSATEQAKSVEVVALDDLNNRDTDGDGVKDWEEALWGTDPTMKDTRGDGVGDFATIEKRRTLLATANASGGSTGTTTVTDVFAQQFFSSVASLKQSGGFTQENVDALAQSAVTNLTVPADPTRYKIENLKTVPSTTENIAAFKAGIKKTSIGLSISTLGNEVTLLSKAINKPKNPQLEKQMQTISSTYALLAERSSRLPVPETMANAYLDLLNAYYGLSIATAGLSLVYSDPVQSVQALSLHKTQTTKLLDAIAKVSAYLKE